MDVWDAELLLFPGTLDASAMVVHAYFDATAPRDCPMLLRLLKLAG